MAGLRRLFLTFSISLITAVSLSALDNPIEKYLSVQLTPQFEIANGKITEYVFDPLCKNTDNKLSELDWNLKTIALFNINADFDVIRYISVGLSGTFGVPQRSDFMQDSDWENSITEDWLNDDPKERTAFSEHINHLDKYIDFKASLGGNIYLPLEIKLSPHAGYKYEYIKMSGSKGYGEYKQAANLTSKKNWEKDWEGTIISYEQEINSFFLGLSVKSNTIPRTSINLNFDISPMLNSLNAIDSHYTRYIIFWDAFKNVVMIESKGSLQYCFSKNHSAGISGRLEYIPISKGNTSLKYMDKKGNPKGDSWIPSTPNGGGTERFIWSLGLNYSFSL